jgi:hypothetical protein
MRIILGAQPQKTRTMTPCEQLEQDLLLEKDVYSQVKWQCVIRFLLGLLNLDWLYDILWAKTRGAGWSDILNALLTLDIALAITFLINLLKEVGLKDAAKELLKRVGPWAIALWAITIAVDIVVLIVRLTAASDRFDAAVKQLYDTTDCTERDKVFAKLNIAIPQ